MLVLLTLEFPPVSDRVQGGIAVMLLPKGQPPVAARTAIVQIQGRARAE
jgi:hypothetical protein